MSATSIEVPDSLCILGAPHGRHFFVIESTSNLASVKLIMEKTLKIHPT
jgi:hypothetical protein